MGAPKQKWTPEEEQALRAGVEKYGPGKWRAIQKDPKYGPYLTQRSNVDLKDKWRNMSVAAGGGSLTPKEKTTPNREARAAAAAAREAIREAESDDGAGLLAKTKPVSTQQYDDMVIHAIHELKEKGGSSTVAILKHAEENNAVPANFKRILTNRIKLLVDDGKIVKVKQNYKLSDATAASLSSGSGGSRPAKRLRSEVDSDSKKAVSQSGGPSSSREPPRTQTTPVKIRKEGGVLVKKPKVETDWNKLKMKSAEEAARLAALAVAEAEAAAAAAEQAAREAELAEAEAEAAEAAAEAAAAAVRPPKKRTTSTTGKAKP